MHAGAGAPQGAIVATRGDDALLVEGEGVDNGSLLLQRPEASGRQMHGQGVWHWAKLIPPAAWRAAAQAGVGKVKDAGQGS